MAFQAVMKTVPFYFSIGEKDFTIFTVQHTESDYYVVIRFEKYFLGYIYWGDGTSIKHPATVYEHMYRDTELHTVKIYGRSSYILYLPQYTRELVKLGTGVTSARSLASYNRTIQTLSDDFIIPENITDCYHMFYRSSLAYIPDGFTIPETVQRYEYMFSETDITEINNMVFNATEESTDRYDVFSGCNSLSKINGLIIGNQIRHCNYWFNRCKNLETVTGLQFGDHVEDCSYMFSHCTSLRTMQITSLSVTNCSHMFNNSALSSLDGFTFTSGIQNCYGMFMQCQFTELKNITLPSTVTNCSFMFAYCHVEKIKNVYIPDSVTSCENFCYAENLKSIDGLRLSMNSIDRVFDSYNMHHIVSVKNFNVGNSNTLHLFSGHSTLEEVQMVVPAGRTNPFQGQGLFGDCINLKTVSLDCRYEKNLEINSMFLRCENLESLNGTVFPNESNINTNMYQAFSGCHKLKNLANFTKLPPGYVDCDWLCSDCNNLEIDITHFFDNITGGDFYRAFSGCYKIIGTAPADKLWNNPNISNGLYCFRGCTSLTNYDEIPDDWK